MVSKTRKVGLHVLAATHLSQIPSRLMDRPLLGSVGTRFKYAGPIKTDLQVHMRFQYTYCKDNGA